MVAQSHAEDPGRAVRGGKLLDLRSSAGLVLAAGIQVLLSGLPDRFAGKRHGSRPREGSRPAVSAPASSSHPEGAQRVPFGTRRVPFSRFSLTRFAPSSYDPGTVTRTFGASPVEPAEERSFRARFGVRLERARRRGKLTQQQLAHRLGRDRRAVGRWESGKAVPEPELLVALARELRVSLD